MEVKIKYEDILKRCEMLSSFESEGKADANGESRYLELHINKVDEQLIQQYINQARGVLEERLDRMIADKNEEEGHEIIDPTPTYEYRARLTSGDMGRYTTIDSICPPYVEINEIVYVEGEMKFAAHDGHNTIYTNLASVEQLGDERYNYIEESGVKKVYKMKGSSQEQTWASLTNGGHTGAGLVNFNRETIIVPHTFTWSIRTTTRWNGIKTFTKHVHEAIVSYAMAAWLRGKLDDRVAFYEGLFNNTLAQAVKNLFTKQPPKK